jgi:hypothetical protein
LDSENAELLLSICEQRRSELKDAYLKKTNVDQAAKNFAVAFNAYQATKAKNAGINVKRISHFHILRNISQIVSSVKD